MQGYVLQLIFLHPYRDIFVSLYQIRNFVFQINPSSIRNMIPGSYVKNLNALEDKSETAKGFIEYVGTTEVPGMPTPMGIAFLAVVTLMIVGQIWLPKK